MNKTPLECTKLSSRGTKSSLNFISTLLHEPGRKTPKSKQKINYSKVLKPSFIKFANIVCKNESKALSFTFEESHLKLSKKPSEVLEKLRNVSDAYNLSPFMRVREDYLRKKQRILVEKKAKELEFQERFSILQEQREKLTAHAGHRNRKSGKIDEFKQIELQEYLQQFSRNKEGLNHQGMVEKLLEAVKNNRVSDPQTFGEIFSSLQENQSESLVSSLCYELLQEIEKTKKIQDKTFLVSQQKLETLKKVESFKTFDTKTSLNSVYF